MIAAAEWLDLLLAAIAAPDAPGLCDPGLHYVAFRSDFMSAGVRIGYEVDDETLDYQFGSIGPEFILMEVWLGATDLTMFLADDVCKVLAGEAQAELKRQRRNR